MMMVLESLSNHIACIRSKPLTISLLNDFHCKFVHVSFPFSFQLLMDQVRGAKFT